MTENTNENDQIKGSSVSENRYTGEYGNFVEKNEAFEKEYSQPEQTKNTLEEESVSEQSGGDKAVEATETPEAVEYEDVEKSSQETLNDSKILKSDDTVSGSPEESAASMEDGKPEEKEPQMHFQTMPKAEEPSPAEKKQKNDKKQDTKGSGSRGFVKTLLLVAVSAILFGCISAVCFQGVNYFLGGRFTKDSVVNAINGKNVDIKETTDDVKYNSVQEKEVGTKDVSAIAEQTMPSIVAITSTQEGQDYYSLFGQYSSEDTTSCGSGFLVGKNDSELLIATNNHVIEGAKTISVQFYDDEVYEAKVKGTDSSADLAVVAVKLKDMKKSTLNSIRIATLGDSSETKVGEMVVAIGNALGYGQSVTVGYVSAKNREINEGSENSNSTENGNTLKVIQTDAAINPGNSGGALLNMKGEVVGINSAKIAASSVEGVGYAIPISEATPIIDELMNKEVLTEEEQGYLGISGKTVSEEAASFNMPEGVYVSEVAKDGAAEKAGIAQGDIITSINGIQVTTIESLKEKANSYKKGTKVKIGYKRNTNGTYEEKEVEVTLQGKDSLNDLTQGQDSQNSDNQNQGNQDPQGDYGDQQQQPDDNQDSGDSWGDFFPFNFGY